MFIAIPFGSYFMSGMFIFLRFFTKRSLGPKLLSYVEVDSKAPMVKATDFFLYLVRRIRHEFRWEERLFNIYIGGSFRCS